MTSIKAWRGTALSLTETSTGNRQLKSTWAPGMPFSTEVTINHDEQVHLLDEDEASDNMTDRMNATAGDLDRSLNAQQPATDHPALSTKEKRQRNTAALSTRTQPPRSAGRPSCYPN